MPVAKSLSKVVKKVEGQEKSVHPRGRKFKQLNKATLRQAKLAKHRTERQHAKEAERKCSLKQIYGINEKLIHIQTCDINISEKL